MVRKTLFRMPVKRLLGLVATLRPEMVDAARQGFCSLTFANQERRVTVDLLFYLCKTDAWRAEMEAAYVTSKGQLVVPVKLRRRYGIKPGTKVFFVERGDEILFQPVTREYIRSVCGMLASATSVAAELLSERDSDKQRESRLEKLGAR